MKEKSPSGITRIWFDCLAVPSGAIFARWTALTAWLGLIVLTSILAFWEKAMVASFEWVSRLFSLPPCGVYSAREGAIVIIGGADGLSRNIALSFSELGYTVFVLYPVRLQKSFRLESGQSTDVSSLLYLWHKRKEGSDHPWGLVAPISFDTESDLKRIHASDTVHAYCTEHSLNLVSLIVLLPSHTPCEDTPIRRRADVITTACTGPSGPTWQQGIGHTLMEPVILLEDYADLLGKASGRIIMLSVCSHNVHSAASFPHSLLDGVQERISRNLSHIMNPLGIRVCSVHVGPLETDMNAEVDVAPSASRSPSSNHRMLWGLRLAIQDMLWTSIISHDALCNALQQIVTSRYPKYAYSLGALPFLHKIWDAFPDIFRLFIHLICTYAE